MRLRELREERTLSTRELAEQAGLNHATIIRLEGGQTGAHPRTIRRLASALGVQPRDLRRKTGDDE